MDAELFAAADAAIRQAGSAAPEAVAARLGVTVIEMHGRLIGYATRYATLPVIGLSAKLDRVWRGFAFWHELGHVLRGHIDEPAFGRQHCDTGLFPQEVDSRAISRQEREANLISAEYNLDTAQTLELLGYDRRALRDYRALRSRQAELDRACAALRSSAEAEGSGLLRCRLREYRAALRALEEKKQVLEEELLAENCLRSLPELAGALGTSETILRYKLEALRLRGYEIDLQELRPFGRVFREVL